uniref:Putative LOC101737344 [Bombyx mori] n=1 Tax=Lepeophtheirus salmonis TaxID=72036 RepID=A0A0K2TES9_LEPSM|nr:uncharacterized protein LOC121116062 [Lepeophtheirus salmonis]
MRRCCCCIPILVGAGIFGLLGVIISLCELLVTITYLIDFEQFNPIGKNINTIYYLFEKSLADQGTIEYDEIENLVALARSITYKVILAETINASIHCLCCILMLLGIYMKRRLLMIPYLIATMILVIFSILLCFLLTGVSFLHNPIHGGISLFGTIVVVFMSIYIWAVVQRAYVFLGRRGDYNYTPAHPKGVFPDEYYPTAPQHFQMTETDKRI